MSKFQISTSEIFVQRKMSPPPPVEENLHVKKNPSSPYVVPSFERECRLNVALLQKLKLELQIVSFLCFFPGLFTWHARSHVTSEYYERHVRSHHFRTTPRYVTLCHSCNLWTSGRHVTLTLPVTLLATCVMLLVTCETSLVTCETSLVSCVTLPLTKI